MWYNIYRSRAGASHYEVTIMPKTMTLKEAQAAYSLSIEASQVSQGPIFVEYEGRPVAVIMSIQDYRQRFSHFILTLDGKNLSFDLQNP
jgi:hypothetical protein